MSGRFITFEGGDGAGKTLQAQLLAGVLKARGHAVLLTREPGGAPGAEDIRQLLVNGEPGRWSALAETMLMFAARAEHVARTIRPALEAGTWVICDRFTDSTMAYQGIGRGVGEAPVCALHALLGIDPDLTLILDIDEETGLKRAGLRGGADRFERMGADFHRTVRQAFRAIAAIDPQRCRLIDAAGTPDDVHARILAALADRGLLV